MEELKWYGWKDVKVDVSLLGDTITKGDGIWKKGYVYVKTPCGYGYDNYCFLLSDKLVHYTIGEDKCWFSICHNMKIELVYAPEYREQGKKYKRYKMTGYELFESVFSDYGVNFAKESEERLKKEQQEKAERDKKNIGSIVCGVYMGNEYGNINVRYNGESIAKAYFYSSGGRYSNSKFSKVQNVKRDFVILDNVSKHDFLRVENILNLYLEHYFRFAKAKEESMRFVKKRLEWKEPEVTRKLSDIYDGVTAEYDKAIEDVKARMTAHMELVLSQQK